MIKVLVIDDSALVRELLCSILATDREIEVVGTAADPIFAIKKIKETKPDVITLDLEMPRMDGLTFLRKLMAVYPTPVVVISTRAQMGSEMTLKALELGAVSVVAKPVVGISQGLKLMHKNIIQAVKQAAKTNMSLLRKEARKNVLSERSKHPKVKSMGQAYEAIKSTDRLIAIGASTGGTVAVREILGRLPPNLPAIFIILHMPRGFTKSFAEGLNRDCAMVVKEIEDRELIRKGYAYVAPGGKHSTVKKGEKGYYFSLDEEPPVNRFIPSIDKAFFSVAQEVGNKAIGVILTGMGSDGALGLKEMKNKGAYTIAQDQATSVVYGMPKRAAEMGAVDEILPIGKIADAIIEQLKK